MQTGNRMMRQLAINEVTKSLFFEWQKYCPPPEHISDARTHNKGIVQGGSQMKRAISEKEAAKYLGIAATTLRQGRCEGRRDNRIPPPPYCKIGTRKIVYLISDLDKWLEDHRVEPV